jgi:transcriptional regulator GlxA family with amidase domain
VSDARRLLWAKDLIDRSFAEPLDVTSLARRVALSPDFFGRAFKRAFGETPYQYLMTRRIERAAALLRGSDLAVTEVCLAVGFTSLGSFSARFRELTGESPTGYRRAARNSGEADTAARIPSCVLRRHTRPTRNESVLEKHGRAAG